MMAAPGKAESEPVPYGEAPLAGSRLEHLRSLVEELRGGGFSNGEDGTGAVGDDHGGVGQPREGKQSMAVSFHIALDAEFPNFRNIEYLVVYKRASSFIAIDRFAWVGSRYSEDPPANCISH
jgi:hypothetical protein